MKQFKEWFEAQVGAAVGFFRTEKGEADPPPILVIHTRNGTDNVVGILPGMPDTGAEKQELMRQLGFKFGNEGVEVAHVGLGVMVWFTTAPGGDHPVNITPPRNDLANRREAVIFDAYSIRGPTWARITLPTGRNSANPEADALQLPEPDLKKIEWTHIDPKTTSVLNRNHLLDAFWRGYFEAAFSPEQLAELRKKAKDVRAARATDSGPSVN
jgi:hypothetical protein